MPSASALVELNLDELASLMPRSGGPAGGNGDAPFPRVVGHPPLSYAQERLVFMDRLAEGHCFYNLAYAVNITGDLDVAALRRAWLDIVERHETLRSFFPDDEQGNPCVRFLAAERCSLCHEDLRSLGPVEQNACIEKQTRDMVASPYSLRTGPLARGTVLRKGENEWMFLYGFHHSIFDGWSQAVFQEELSTAYAARRNNAAPSMPSLPVSHGQYALWQRQRMEGPLGAAECAWWRRYLADVDDLRVITDKPRPRAQSFDGDSVTFTIPGTVSGALEDVARQSGASPFMLWTSLFAIVLGRYSGQKRFAIGGSLAGRTRPETESLIGFLVNNLVIKIANDPGRTFREHLRSVQESVLASYTHGEYPFQLIAQSLGGGADLSRNPIYQATFTYQNYQKPCGSPEGLSLAEVPVPILSTHVDLDLIAWPTGEGIVCCLLYATDLFLRETAEGFGSALAALARHVAENPDATLAQIFSLGVLPDLSRRPLSVLIGKEVGYEFLSPWDRLLAQAERIPDAPALVIGAERRTSTATEGRDGVAAKVTFSQLAAMSSRFADVLNGRGVGVGKRTVILAYTGVELFVAMFAVWHRNGAWLLVDPDIPKARLTTILAEAAPDSIITTREILAQSGLEDENSLPGCLHLLADWTGMPTSPGEVCPVWPEPEDIAMFFCTSGSTGSPKTAPCTHDAVSKRLSWEMEEYPLGEQDVCCLKSSVSYADFFYEAFMPILSGVPLLLLGHSPALDVLHLMRQMEVHGVTKMVAVPSLLKVMHRVSQGFAGRLQRLRLIRTSGEPMPTQLAESITRAIPGVTLYSVYGALEMHNPTAFRYAQGGGACDAMHLPAGHPLPGRAVALLDAYGLPVPLGERGELYAGGWGLTPGYLSGGRADCFPVLDIGGQVGRWYRSGDMGHVDEQGRLHVSGRKDFQIKVRGVRIEPDEVEGVMLRFPQVGEAKIAAWEDAAGNQRLHGFVILDPAVAPAKRACLAGELRSFLFDALPAVMVPDHITVLEEWPHTATGKTHVAQLKEAFARQSAMTDRLETRRYRGAEEAVAGIWRKVLGDAPFPDIKTAFFAAGGNSLLLIALHNELQTGFHQEFPLALLFQNPTIESQALFLESNARTRGEAVRGDAPQGRSVLLARRGMSRG